MLSSQMTVARGNVDIRYDLMKLYRTSGRRNYRAFVIRGESSRPEKARKKYLVPPDGKD